MLASILAAAAQAQDTWPSKPVKIIVPFPPGGTSDSMARLGGEALASGVGSNAVAHGLEPKLAYDSNKDFIHISQIHSGPTVLVVHPDQPFKSLKQLINFVRANPGKLNCGYTHAASGHTAMELLKQVAGVDGPPLFIVGIP